MASSVCEGAHVPSAQGPAPNHGVRFLCSPPFGSRASSAASSSGLQMPKNARGARIVFRRLACDRRNAALCCGDGFLAVEDPENRVIGAALAMLQPDHLAAIACRQIAQDMMG